METSIPLLFAAAVGFGHAFEADHLVAVSNIVTQRNRLSSAVKDGIYWGLGHTSTILIIGLLLIVGKATFLNDYFDRLEILVGIMLIVLGTFRLYRWYQNQQIQMALAARSNDYHLAYGVGLIHGIAGSGAVMLLVMTEMQTSFGSLLYLLLFGLGSVAGMLVAACLFSLPFSKKMAKNARIQLLLITLSSILCIGFGIFIISEQLHN